VNGIDFLERVHGWVIMDLLGHSDIGVTMNTYAHIMQASRDEAAQSMQEMFTSRKEGK
jgi:integrase